MSRIVLGFLRVWSLTVYILATLEEVLTQRHASPALPALADALLLQFLPDFFTFAANPNTFLMRSTPLMSALCRNRRIGVSLIT